MGRQGLAQRQGERRRLAEEGTGGVGVERRGKGAQGAQGEGCMVHKQEGVTHGRGEGRRGCVRRWGGAHMGHSNPRT